MALSESSEGTRVDLLHARAPDAVSALRTVEPSNDELMARVAAGDGAACRLLVERHLGRVLGLARRTLGDPAEAEDIAQEAFLRLWSHAAKWRPGEARLTTWLYRVVINLCTDRRPRRRHVPLDEAPDPPDPQSDVTQSLHREDVARHVRAEIMALTESQRMAIALCHYQGLRNTDAAELMGVSVEALESLLARARRTLRERLRPVATELLEAIE